MAGFTTGQPPPLDGPVTTGQPDTLESIVSEEELIVGLLLKEADNLAKSEPDLEDAFSCVIKPKKEFLGNYSLALVRTVALINLKFIQVAFTYTFICSRVRQWPVATPEFPGF